jgi:hypothetical protein
MDNIQIFVESGIRSQTFQSQMAKRCGAEDNVRHTRMAEEYVSGRRFRHAEGQQPGAKI